MDKKSADELTTAARMARALEEDIVDRTLKPGAELDERLIAERFGVSRTPVREALRKLAADGLVEMRPRRKAIVSALDMQRMAQMFEVLGSLESLAAECATRRISAALIDELSAIHDQIGACIAARQPEDYEALNLAFHRTIYRGAGNAYLEGQVDILRQRLSPYRRWLMQKMNRMQLSHDEHGRILAAIREGNARLAAEEMRAHVGDDDLFLDFMMSESGK
jgi:DNA-binding GntR family transcriptional regulator